MKFIAAVLIGVCCSVTNVYAEDNCESAVDDADSMNVNRKDCDYTKEGLNGVLHKAFNKGSEGAVLETSTDKSLASADKPALKKAVKATSESAYLLLSVEVDQWANVPVARNQLLPKAMEKCERGFSVHNENYRPLPMGRIGLSIVFSCL